MSILGDVNIKVDTATLHDKALKTSKSIKNMAECFDQMERIIDRTSYYWIGEAGDLHRAIYKQQKSQIDEMLKRLKEYPSDLTSIAGNYIIEESQIESFASELPSNTL